MSINWLDKDRLAQSPRRLGLFPTSLHFFCETKAVLETHAG